MDMPFIMVVTAQIPTITNSTIRTNQLPFTSVPLNQIREQTREQTNSARKIIKCSQSQNLFHYIVVVVVVYWTLAHTLPIGCWLSYSQTTFQSKYGVQRCLTYLCLHINFLSIAILLL